MKKWIALLLGALLVCGLSACASAPADSGSAARDAASQATSQTPTDGADAPDDSAAALDDSTATTGDGTATTDDSAAPGEADGNQDAQTAPADGAGADAATDDAETPAATADAAGGKVLVVYYSATGNTENAANYIAAATGGDLFELVPQQAYTDEDLNYRDPESWVVYEHDHPEAREIALVETAVDGWKGYDTVFIGYPIWWQIAAWPVDGFVKANDFTGKTVIPFCTSSSSELGESGALLQEMAGTGTWLEGQRFSSRVTEQAVADWVAGLELTD